MSSSPARQAPCRAVKPFDFPGGLLTFAPLAISSLTKFICPWKHAACNAVTPELGDAGALMLAPRSRRSSTTSSCPLSAAAWMGVRALYLVTLLGSTIAPASSKRRNRRKLPVYSVSHEKTCIVWIRLCTNLYHKQARKHCDRCCSLPEHEHQLLPLSEPEQRDGGRASRLLVMRSAHSIPSGDG